MNETDALKRPFLRGLAAVAVVFIVLGGLIAIFGSNADRGEGVAERWLNAVSDTTRKGVKDDARKRALERGPFQLVDALVPPGIDTDGKTAFTELEVGNGQREGDLLLVPFLAHRRDIEGESGDVDGVVVMRKDTDDWHVVDIRDRPAGARLPSEGGPPVSSAPLGLYAGALVVGLLVTVGASILVRAAGRGDR